MFAVVFPDFGPSLGSRGPRQQNRSRQRKGQKLSHGPHSVRDVLATHLLKQTGSYELAGFAIQDITESVMRHYARFLSLEKTARAAEMLNRVWQQTDQLWVEKASARRLVLEVAPICGISQWLALPR